MVHVELLKPRTVLGDSILHIKLQVEAHLSIHGHLVSTKGKPVLLAAGDVVFKVSGGVISQAGEILSAGTTPVKLIGHELTVVISLLTVRTGEVHPECLEFVVRLGKAVST